MLEIRGLDTVCKPHDKLRALTLVIVNVIIAPKTWVVTGGAGYIGAHVVRSLTSHGFRIVVVDDLSKGRIERVPTDVMFIQSTIHGLLDSLASLPSPIDGVIHLASLKNARESVADPDAYWDSVFNGTQDALTLADEIGAPNFVFASSCSVFGSQTRVSEHSEPMPESPYGEAKLAAEGLVRAFGAQDRRRAIVLRFFNVVGNDRFPAAIDESGGHLIPSLIQARNTGTRIRLFRAGGYTPDGTCLRDYLDVRDVAVAHLLCANYLTDSSESNFCEFVNLSLGEGISSLQIAAVFEKISDSNEPLYDLFPSQEGDPSIIVGAPSEKAMSLLGWVPQFSVEESLVSVWEASNSVQLR